MSRFKLAVGTLVAVICLGLAACGGAENGGGSQPNSSASSSSSHGSGWG